MNAIAPRDAPSESTAVDGYAWAMEDALSTRTGDLEELIAGQRIPFAGNRWTEITPDLAAAFRPGDRLVVVQTTGEILHIPGAISGLTDRAVRDAREGFQSLIGVNSDGITAFYAEFADRLSDDMVFADIVRANETDVADARRRGRSTTRLVLDEKMRRSMVDALHMWRDMADGRDVPTNRVAHRDWSVTECRAPLGVVGFVFEGRPNVFADATGVLRSGNVAVLRIGSDALGTARAMMAHALRPALAATSLPQGSIVLMDSPERSAGHALFSHPGIALAVARGSGPAVAQLGAVARQSGIPVSLHGTGGAWMIIAPSAEDERIIGCIEASLDRKVCNTVNVLCVPRHDARLLRSALSGLQAAARRSQYPVRLHVVGGADDMEVVRAALGNAPREIDLVHESDENVLAREWEWDSVPEVSLRLVETLDEAIDVFNRHSPQFIVSVVTSRADDVDEVYRGANAPFVGDGFTRWVDGQYALSRPELGLSNWQEGRLFARGGILSGDGVFSVRYRATHSRSDQRR